MKPQVRKIKDHPIFPGEFICQEPGSSIYGNGRTIGFAIECWVFRMEALRIGHERRVHIDPLIEVSPGPSVAKRRKPWQTLWLSLVGLVFVAAVAVSCQRAQAYELQQCEWLSNQAYSQAWQRDAGVTFQQLKVLIRRGDERAEWKTGLVALGRYVYSHPEMTPDDLADDILTTCKSYDQ